MAHKYIAVAGNMGSGKSSLIDFLCKHFQVRPFFERNDINPFFNDFYKDMKRWAFHSQMYFLTQKFNIHVELDKCKETVVQDRTIYEDAEIFAKNLAMQGFMSKPEFRNYWDLYETIQQVIAPPDLLIYVECPTKVLLKRIAKRGRAAEKNIPEDYVRKLHQLYSRWIKNYKRSPVLHFSSEKTDYLEDFIHRDDLLKKIAKHL